MGPPFRKKEVSIYLIEYVEFYYYQNMPLLHLFEVKIVHPEKLITILFLCISCSIFRLNDVLQRISGVCNVHGIWNNIYDA